MSAGRKPAARGRPQPRRDDGESDGRWLVGAALRLAVVLLVALAVNHFVGGAIRDYTADLLPREAEAMRRGLLMATVLYAVLLALPFVPGVEIGLAVLAVLGTAAVPHIFAATVAGLSLSFLAGRLVPLGALQWMAAKLRMQRSAGLLQRLAATDRDGRLALLMERTPNRMVPYLIRRRYLALALLLNLPGNMLIGGGGGIALAAGMSRIFAPAAFVVTVTVAVSPVPILFWVLGDEGAVLHGGP